MATAAVYIVDDDAAVLDSMQSLLASLHVDCEAFESGERFLREADLSRVACIVLDLRMPKISGCDLQRYLVEQRVDMPIVFLSGHGTVPEAVHAIKSGAVDFLEKPCCPEELLATIRRAIAIAEERRRLALDRLAIEAALAKLNPEERAVFVAIAEGKSNREVADELDVSLRTVQFRRTGLLATLGLSTKSELRRLLQLYRRFYL